MELQKLKNIIEALLLSADKPLDIRHLESLFEQDEDDKPGKDDLLQAMQGHVLAQTELMGTYTRR